MTGGGAEVDFPTRLARRVVAIRWSPTTAVGVGGCVLAIATACCIPYAWQITLPLLTLACGGIAYGCALIAGDLEGTAKWDESLTRLAVVAWLLLSVATSVVAGLTFENGLIDSLATFSIGFPMRVRSVIDTLTIAGIVRAAFALLSLTRSPWHKDSRVGAMVAILILVALGFVGAPYELRDCIRLFDPHCTMIERWSISTDLANGLWIIGVFPLTLVRDRYAPEFVELSTPVTKIFAKRTIAALCIVVPAGLGIVLLARANATPIFEPISGLWWLRKTLVVAVGASLPEQALWRLGVCCALMRAAKDGIASTNWVEVWLVSSTLFGLAHFGQGLIGIAFGIVLGLSTGYLLLQRHSLSAAVVCHTLADCILVQWSR